jgi:hypothetical protein
MGEGFSTISWQALGIIIPVMELFAGAAIVMVVLIRGRSSIGRPFSFAKSSEGISASTNGWILTIVCGVVLIALPLYHISTHDDEEKKQLKVRVDQLTAMKLDEMDQALSKIAKAESYNVRIEARLPGNPLYHAHVSDIEAHLTGVASGGKCVVADVTPEGIVVNMPEFPVTQESAIQLEITWKGKTFTSNTLPVGKYQVELSLDSRDQAIKNDPRLKSLISNSR